MIPVLVLLVVVVVGAIGTSVASVGCDCVGGGAASVTVKDDAVETAGTRVVVVVFGVGADVRRVDDVMIVVVVGGGGGAGVIVVVIVVVLGVVSLGVVVIGVVVVVVVVAIVVVVVPVKPDAVVVAVVDGGTSKLTMTDAH